jgi:hypothetical protein
LLTSHAAEPKIIAGQAHACCTNCSILQQLNTPSILHAVRAAEQEVRDVIARYDVNGDGIIDYSEFLKVRCV